MPPFYSQVKVAHVDGGTHNISLAFVYRIAAENMCAGPPKFMYTCAASSVPGALVIIIHSIYVHTCILYRYRYVHTCTARV